MKTILIIISVVVWVVIKFVKAKKKQDAQRQTVKRPISKQRSTSSQTNESYSIESLLTGLTGEGKEEKTQTVKVKNERRDVSYFISSDKKEESTYNNIQDKQEVEAIMKEGVSAIPDRKSKINIYKEEIEETTPFINNEFDLRQAVLFSEILNNPYFEKNY